jgi:pantoate--beta-alanine ligase
VAPAIYLQLQQAVASLRAGVRDFARIETGGIAALNDAGFRTDYFNVRDARFLGPPAADTKDFVVLTAARLGKARLIDNIQFSA